MNPISETIGFAGVGRMGASMARRLRDCGIHVVAVFDINPNASRELAAEIGAEACTTLAAVTARADIVFTVVSDDAAQQAVFGETADSLLTNSRGKLFVNCATLTPKVHVEVERRAQLAGAQTLECCMASSITHARGGKLYLMCGGDREVFLRAQPVAHATKKQYDRMVEAGMGGLDKSGIAELTFKGRHA